MKLLKIYKIANQRLRIFSVNFHKFSHLLRNEFYKLCVLRREGKLSETVLEQSLEGVCARVTNFIAEKLRISTGRDVTVSIKYFCINERIFTDNFDDDELGDLEVTVLCRSDNANQKRIDRRRGKIRENTDLSKILIENFDEFAVTNLPRYDKELKRLDNKRYRDSNEEWQDFYKTKLTVPIRIQSDYTYDNINTDGFELIGFISADANSTSAFQEKEIESYTELLKGYADTLYKYFDRFLYFWDIVEKDKEAIETSNRQ